MENKKLIPLQYYLLVLLFLAKSSSSSEDNLFPNYDQGNSTIKVYELKGSIFLSCGVTNDTSKLVDLKLEWYKDGKKYDEWDESIKSRTKILEKEHSLTIVKSMESDSGTYTCYKAGSPNKRDFNVVSKVYVKVPSNVYAVEEEKLKITCIVYGTNPIVWWDIDGEKYDSSTDEIQLEAGGEQNIENSVLVIEKVTLNDRKKYTCNAKNDGYFVNQHIATDNAFVRVKSKFAALWPFIGIVAEVVLLCLIIFCCEKRRNKQELDESDTDQSPEQKSDHGEKSSNIRHRK